MSERTLVGFFDYLWYHSWLIVGAMTKLHEEVFRGPASEAIAHFMAPRGEFSIIIQGGDSSASESSAAQKEGEAVELLSDLRLQGLRAKEAVSQTVDIIGLPRRAVYRLWLSLSDSKASQMKKD